MRENCTSWTGPCNLPNCDWNKIFIYKYLVVTAITVIVVVIYSHVVLVALNSHNLSTIL